MLGILVLVATLLLQQQLTTHTPGEPQEAWIIPAIMGAVSLVDYLKNRRKDKQVAQEQQQANQQMQGATNDAGARANTREQAADTSRQNYEQQLEGFDPQTYAHETAGALAGDFGELYQGMETQRRLATQRSGFLGAPTGIGSQTRDLNTRIARSLAGVSMDTARMKQGSIDRYGDLQREDASRAEGARDREVDLIAGNRDYATGAQNDRTQRRNGVLNALATGAGAYYGSRG